MYDVEIEGKRYTVHYQYYRLSEPVGLLFAGGSIKPTAKHVRGWANVHAPYCATVYPRGGYTQAYIELGPHTKIIAESICSFSDNFDKRVGRELAYNRLKQAFETVLFQEDL